MTPSKYHKFNLWLPSDIVVTILAARGAGQQQVPGQQREHSGTSLGTTMMMMTPLLVLATTLSLASAQARGDPASPGTGFFLTEAAQTKGAVCLDGTPGAYCESII